MDFYSLRTVITDTRNMLYPEPSWMSIKDLDALKKSLDWHTLSTFSETIIFEDIIYNQDSDLSKLLDLYGNRGVLEADYILLSEKAARVFMKYKLPEHKFLQSIILREGEKYKYFILQFLSKSFFEIIDFEKSFFTEWFFSEKRYKGEGRYKISSYDDYLKLWDSMEEKDNNLFPGPLHLCFNDEYKDLDFVMLPAEGLVVSERLANSLFEKTLLGVELKKVNQIKFE